MIDKYYFKHLNDLSFDKISEDKDKYVVFACAKHENKYIVEWVNHYLNYGFDKIFIADNNEIGDNSLSEILSEYINRGEVQIFDLRGYNSIQVQIYSDFCEIGNYKWCAYFDCDEFLELNAYSSIKDFLSAYGENYDCISFNWLMYGPNGNIKEYEGKIQDRFSLPISPILYFKENVFIKSIVKGGTDKFKDCWFNGSHIPIPVNMSDVKYSIGGYYDTDTTIHAHFPPKYKTGYLKHYYTKSFEEWINKSGRGWPDGTEKLKAPLYFLFNENLTVPIEQFTKGLFHSYANDFVNIINDFDTIEIFGNFVYPYIINIIGMMANSKNHTFVVDSNIDETLFTILFEYAIITGNRLVAKFNDDTLWSAINKYSANKESYYSITFT